MSFNREEFIQSFRKQEQTSVNRSYRLVRRYLLAKVNKAIQVTQNQGIAAAQSYNYTDAQDTEDLIREILTKEGFEFYLWQKRYLDNLKRKPDVEVGFFSEVWKQRILNVMRSLQMFALIRQIDNTTRTRIRQIFIVATEQRLGAREVARMLKKDFAFSKARALTIARTEVHYSSYLGKEYAADQSQYRLKKEWIHGYANEPRPHHIELDGTTIPRSQKFDVGGKMMNAPGDLAGGASENINCSCTVAYLLDE